MFGLKPNQNVLLWWGARAILQRNQEFDTYVSSRRGASRFGRMSKKKPNRYHLDLLWDRQGWYCRPWEDGAVEECTSEDQAADRKKISEWVNKVGLQKIMEEFDKAGGDQASDVLVTYQDEKDGYFIMANPNRSHGYMYLCAGKKANK